MSERCIFEPAWQRRCGKPTVSGTDFCEAHYGKQCSVCGQQATNECNHAGQFVCGVPLCDNCEGYEKPLNQFGTTDHGAWGFLRHGHRVKVKAGELD